MKIKTKHTSIYLYGSLLFIVHCIKFSKLPQIYHDYNNGDIFKTIKDLFPCIKTLLLIKDKEQYPSIQKDTSILF